MEGYGFFNRGIHGIELSSRYTSMSMQGLIITAGFFTCMGAHAVSTIIPGLDVISNDNCID